MLEYDFCWENRLEEEVCPEFCRRWKLDADMKPMGWRSGDPDRVSHQGTVTVLLANLKIA